MKSEKPKEHEEQLEEITKCLKNVPGLDELKQAGIAARNEEKYYDAMYERMFDAGENMYSTLFVRTQRDKFLKTSKEYPRAAVYLRAMEYYKSSDHHVSCVGFVALQMINSGGPLLTARRILNNCMFANRGEPLKTNHI